MQTVSRFVPDGAFTIYRLRDPRENTIRYIGITLNVFERFKQHLRCDGVNPAKDAWIRELEWAQLLPLLDSIERVGSFAEALDREKYWIGQYLQQGENLFNLAALPRTRLVKPQTSKNATSLEPVPHIPCHVEDWDIAKFPVCMRHDRYVTVEYATEEEFQSWLECNGVDASYVDREVLGEARRVTHWFTRRCLIINDALDQGMSLELADGTVISIAQERAPSLSNQHSLKNTEDAGVLRDIERATSVMQASREISTTELADVLGLKSEVYARMLRVYVNACCAQQEGETTCYHC
jgi:hypothetical protein